jgi:transposase
VFLKFLRRLVRQVRRKVFLILDGHSAHKAKDIQPRLARNRGKLKLLFLPGYSPELNPDELLKQDVKSKAVGRRPPLDAENLMSNVRAYLRRTQRMPHVVQSFFDGEHVRYAR